ncbi:MAG TPA: Uma2 family endonuclease [Pirellulales bacterium]|nr:Uma2 family endonuclease [Pirellulales bacterium]
MYGLEYALFFGVPENKLELIDGSSRWAFPFSSRDEGEAHFQQWLETFRRWKQVETPTPVRKSAGRWRAEVSGIRMELFPGPIDIRLPIAWQAFKAFLHTFNRRDYWPGQPDGFETGWDSMFDDGDIRLNLWSMLGVFSSRHGGKRSSRVDVALAPWAGVAPDSYYFRKERQNIMIEGDYFCAAPDLVAEVLSAPSRWLDRGPRREVYRRAGVPHLWLVEPAQEIVEVYELRGHYELLGRHGLGDSFAAPLFPGEQISVDALFETQAKSKGWPNAKDDEEAPEPIPDWILPPEMEVGLECFFHLGHPQRRWEFWDNKARSVLAFGSAAEATARLDHFLTEACRWEALPRPKIAELAGDVRQTEVGRFQLTRRGRLVFLDVAVDGRRHQEILTRWADRNAWDWGEKNVE